MAEHKNWWAGHWQEYLDKGTATFRDHNSLVLTAEQLLNTYQGKMTLEVGSGRGVDSLRMAQKGAIAYVVDNAREALEITLLIKKGIQADIRPVQADGVSLPFGDNSFDLVFSQGVMEHPHDNFRMLQEQVRVTKQNGYVLIDVPNKYSLQTPTREVQLRLGRWPYDKEHPYSPASLRNLVEQAGLKPVKLYGRGLIPIIYLSPDSKIRKSIAYNRSSNDGGNLDTPHAAGFFTRYIEMTVGHWFLNNIGIVAKKY